ncbi:DUF292-domain-containing protein [Schizopora paradoxa]|uniref:DUF292-domain-containing protein n=1 Tax=Schizopora paradoxa TaxID=27342 RepID=A0A0H2SEN8_9AGAM|nr:DUF292-domain-containing protein [Schizopora paradoxa]
MPPWVASKAKVQLRIAVQRLRTLQEKKGAQAKLARREIATLVEHQKIEKARVKVETLINDDIHVEMLELLELYCELLLARFGLLDLNGTTPDPGISEGVTSIIYAGHRTELKELHVLREILMHKYGRDFSLAVADNKDNCVSPRIVNKATFTTPEPALVDAYVGEIAKGYGLSWRPPKPDGDGDDAGGSGGLKESVPAVGLDDLKRVDEKYPDTEQGKGPVLPELPPTEDADTSKKTGKGDDGKGTAAPSKPPTSSTAAPEPEPEDAFAALQRRFAELKKR